ncbi:Jag N-terminal domain-containing protein [Helicobacter sp. 13S00477-4]|uniref:Jag N-terminal domain-containing protein n=1 Tax=Helicobacter sp. 13S00477-4 TaxID=1905759 RepID=UPI000BA7E3EA|nr:Jag N-terminal domain-containing protein [Helicobacter sp. 13S00477-4]PAF52553.1 spoIIIJ-associated protein [Helicobacter sp. 13S00477-4]
MKKIVAKTLQEAITQASSELGCSVTELDYEILQIPSKGFLGVGKKDAIIVAAVIKDVSSQRHLGNSSNTDTFLQSNKNHPSLMSENKESFVHIQNNSNTSEEDDIKDIELELKELFSFLPYKINHIEVSLYDPQTLLVTFDGEDSALLIGEKGYRYKALSYLLFNWIQPKYGYNIRLEIAQFLKNQEEAMDIYLQSIITTVYETGKAQTKPLDGILAYIALKKLRETFPTKYVSFRNNAMDERYIIVSDFIRNG